MSMLEKDRSLNTLFMKQIDFQNKVLNDRGAEETILPIEDQYWFNYHMLAMVEELGEVMKADKRWKSHRNTAYNKKEKIDELADVFITVMNMAIFSDIDGREFFDYVESKIEENEINLLASKKLDEALETMKERYK